MSTNNEKNNIVATAMDTMRKENVEYIEWMNAYSLLTNTNTEIPMQNEVYWELAKSIANANVDFPKVNPADTELVDFWEKRETSLKKKKESLKSFVAFSEQWVANSKNVIKQKAALFTLLSAMKDNKITEEQSQLLLNRLNTLSMDKYNDKDPYKNAQDILVEMHLQEGIKNFFARSSWTYAMIDVGRLSTDIDEVRYALRQDYGFPLQKLPAGEEYHK